MTRAYVIIVSLLMVILPALFTILEHQRHVASSIVPDVQKWVVFWSLGIRIALAGVHQILNPEYTLKHLLGIQDKRANIIARELGFGNFACGLAAILSLYIPDWRNPCSFITGLYLVLAGFGHLFKSHSRSGDEKVAMITDLLVGGLCVGFVGVTMLM